MDAKTPMNLRLTGTAKRLMAAMAKKKGISQTAVVELAVRLMAEQEGVKDKGGEDDPDGA